MSCGDIANNNKDLLLTYDTNNNRKIDMMESMSAIEDMNSGKISEADYCVIENAWKKACVYCDMPDLTVTNVDFGSVTSMENININSHFTNQGVVMASHVLFRVFATDLKGNEKQIEADSFFPIINSKETKKGSNLWNPQIAGTYKIRVVVDPDNEIQESNEDNNEFTITVYVTEKIICTDTDGGKDYYTKGYVTEKNQYTDWQDNTFPDMCVSDNPPYNLAEAVCEKRADGHYYGSQVYYTCPNGCKDGACIKSEGKLPDLVVESVEFDDSLHTTTVKIKNIGEADYIYSDYNLSYFAKFVSWQDLSSDKAGSISNYRLINIPAGESAEFTLTREITSYGIHELEITVDAENDIQESNEGNNTKNLTISVSETKLPDLIVESAELKKIIDQHRGEQDVIVVTVKNIGSGYYNYLDSRMEKFVNWSDTLSGHEEGYLGNYRLISIGPGESKEYTKQYVHSSNLKLLKVFVDPENKVKESNEDNNSINIKVKNDSTCLPDGTLIKVPGNPKIYVIENCKKKWIRTAEEFKTKNYNWSNIKEASSETVNAYSNYLEATAKLLRSAGHNKVYRVINGKRLWVPTASAFNAQGLKWNEIEDTSEAEVNQYPEAKLLQVDGDSKIYYITGAGLKRHIPNSQVFLSYNNNWNDVVKVSNTELNAYPDNILIKAKGNYKVYKLENGKKRWIKTARAFNRMGFDWLKIMTVNNVELDAYATGVDIN